MQHIKPDDKTGVRQNISGLMKEVENNNLESFFLGYTRKSDGSVHTFSTGGDEKIVFLLEIMINDIIGKYDRETIGCCGPLNGEDEP